MNKSMTLYVGEGRVDVIKKFYYIRISISKVAKVYIMLNGANMWISDICLGYSVGCRCLQDSLLFQFVRRGNTD